VEKMQRWGARVDASNKEVIVDFLSRRYPYRPRR
jgi:hypothetical protein